MDECYLQLLYGVRLLWGFLFRLEATGNILEQGGNVPSGQLTPY
jgi:hypothetical protein